jgi:hypothetical protein
MNQVSEGELMSRLAEYLQEMPAVLQFVDRRRARSAKEEAWEIAHGLADIRDSARCIFENLLPRLLQLPPSGDEAEDLLYQIGEEYRHILYHITNTDFFSYVVNAGGENDGPEKHAPAGPGPST